MSVVKKTVMVMMFALISCALVPIACVNAAESESIVVRGSDSMAGTVDSYAKEFMAKHPEAHIIVSGGVSKEWDQFIGGKSALCMASSELSPSERKAAEEKGKDVQEKTVAWGGIVIIVHPNNPLNELTVEQVRRIFAGECTNWKQLGGPDESITVLTVGDKREGTLAFMRDQLVKAPITPNAVAKTYFRSIIGSVAEAPSATGFVRVRNIVQLEEQGQQKKIKVLAVKENDEAPAVLPTRESVNNGTYPITRPYMLYMDGKTASPLIKSFFEFCSSKNPRRAVTNAK